MIFHDTAIPGVYLIEPKRRHDERGFFARTFCRETFSGRGLVADFVQCSVSFNKVKGTLRGMHLQGPPHEEAKLIRCTAGAIYDVVLDLRAGSPTYAQWFATELTNDGGRSLYVPEGVAHGFMTLTDGAEVYYQISQAYHPECAGGVRWDDPAFAIDWPIEPTVVSTKDREWPLHTADACIGSQPPRWTTRECGGSRCALE